MIYKILENSNPSLGKELSISIPIFDVDQKALCTIQNDCPDFLLPFRCRTIDETIELVYEPGTRQTISSLSGIFTLNTYNELWYKLLHPVSDCLEWFLRPYSFVLDSNYVHWDFEKNRPSFIYIPSKQDCSDYTQLRDLAVAFSTRVLVDCAEAEVRVLRALLNDFNPKTFLKLLKPTTVTHSLSNSRVDESLHTSGDLMQSTATESLPSLEYGNAKSSLSSDKHETEQASKDELTINFSPDNDSSSKSKGTLREMGISNTRGASGRKKKKTANPNSFFSRLRGGGRDIIIDR